MGVYDKKLKIKNTHGTSSSDSDGRSDVSAWMASIAVEYCASRVRIDLPRDRLTAMNKHDMRKIITREITVRSLSHLIVVHWMQN